MIQQHKDYLYKDYLPLLLLFDNAIYQGGYSKNQKIINGNGVVYFPKQSRAIICSNFKHGQVNKSALIYHNSQKYIYGSWKNDKIEGLALIRIAETVIIGYFSSGKIKTQKRALLLLNQYQLGLVVHLKNGEWQTVQRSEIYCRQHIIDLFKKCDFGNNNIPLSLISFLNQEIVETQNQLAKLRFANNTYQYGFEGGLNLIFTQNQELTSIKFVNQDMFYIKDRQNEIYQKKLNSTVIKILQKQRKSQIGTIYKQKFINNSYILGKEFQDPSLQYFSFVESTFNDNLLKKIKAGLFRPIKNKNSQELNMKQFHLKLSPVNTQVIPSEQIQIQPNQSIIQAINEQESEQQSWQKNLQQNDQVIENSSFQMLPHESRLNIIKHQQREILISKMLRQKNNLNPSLRNQTLENQSDFFKNKEQTQNRQKLQDKQSQTEVVLLSSPFANKSQSGSPLSQKRKRTKIFNTESALINSSPQKKFEYNSIEVQTQKRTNNRFQILENVVNQIHLSRNSKKQAESFLQIESRIANEIQQDRGGASLVNQINSNPIKNNIQFILGSIQMTTPNRNHFQNQSIEIKTHQKKQTKMQDDVAEHYFVGILNNANKNNKSNKKYDTEGLSDKKLLFDYLLI